MEEQFNNLCRIGDLDGAKEFLRLNPDIKISAENEFAFNLAYACENEHLEVAKWLLQINPDIDIL